MEEQNGREPGREVQRGKNGIKNTGNRQENQ